MDRRRTNKIVGWNATGIRKLPGKSLYLWKDHVQFVISVTKDYTVYGLLTIDAELFMWITISKY